MAKLTYEKVFCKAVDPFSTVEWEQRNAKISGSKGETVFELKDIECPKEWSQMALNVVSSKYFYSDKGQAKETSVKGLIDRVVSTISAWGYEDGYFATIDDCRSFRSDLTWLILHQYGSFNSPVWFNVGIAGAFPSASTVGVDGFHYDAGTDTIIPSKKNYEYPQASACQPYYSRVCTPTGLIPIGDIVTKNMIGLSVYDSKGRTKVINVKANGIKPVSRFHLHGNISMDVTGDHLLWDGCKYKPANKFKPGDRLYWYRKNPVIERTSTQQNLAEAAKVVGAGYKKLVIKEIEDIGTMPVYDIQTESGEYLSEGFRIHNCFIQSIDDNMDSIMSLAKSEAMLFKHGSGTGTDLSPLRSTSETVAGGGNASGPLSFLKIYDTIAGVVRSGGRIRRAAKMNVLNISHPDIKEWIYAKVNEERKVKALIAGGFSAEFGGEAYGSILYQNENLSVALTDEFMEAVKKDEMWETKLITTGKAGPAYPAKALLRWIAECAHACGDPGIQFVDTINAWNTCAASGRIHCSNPCQPGFATVLTPDGIRTFYDIDVGSVIWSGEGWTTVTRKLATGNKDVYRYRTSSGSFIGTDSHVIISDGERVKVKDAETIDISVARPSASVIPADKQAVMDGWVIGDGSVHKASNNKVYLYIGKADKDIHTVLADYIIKANGIGSAGTSFDIKTNITANELPRTHLRVIPDRYYYGDYALKCNFLRGLYSANGAICGGRVTLKAASLQLIDQVQIMLSSIGIHSYVTINKERAAEFTNGIYTCKQSYDLNITSDKSKFYYAIGFIQTYKLAKLKKLLKKSSKHKSSYEIKSREFLGNMPVFDITVDAPEHTYWTGGLQVSNCGEFVFLDNSACNLASLNLLKFRTPEGKFDVDRFNQAIRAFIIAQDILVDRASYPTAQIAKNSHEFRPVGLGYANLGALIMSMGLPYGSKQGQVIASSVTSIMTGFAYRVSAELAGIKGPFKRYEENEEPMGKVLKAHHKANTRIMQFDKYLVSTKYNNCKDLWSEVVALDSFRNSQVTLLAPTGTIGFMMDCDTTGIEPDIALVKYKNLIGGGVLKIVNTTVSLALGYLGYTKSAIDGIIAHISDTGTIENCDLLKPEHLPIFDCALKPNNGTRFLKWESHVEMMAAVQPYLSGAISKTVNIAQGATPEDVEKVYTMAWKSGLKGVTIYRDGCKENQPINMTTKRKDDVKLRRRRLPDTRNAKTHKFSIGGHEGYFTVGLYDSGEPGELFIIMSKEGSTLGGIVDAFGTAVSLCLQYGVPRKTLIDKFKHTRFEPSGYTSNKAIHIASSIIDYIFRWMELEYPTEVESKPKSDKDKKTDKAATPDFISMAADTVSSGVVCDNCGSLTIRNGTCFKCTNCGNSLGCS